MKFQESKLAHMYCVGEGLEIGGSAHNPFGLNTQNVDITDEMTTFKQSEIDLCGEFLPVDIVAPGDNIPVSDASQDFCVSSHVLEHFNNPINALIEWARVVRPGGVIFMIVPHRERTFDASKPRTTLDHVVQDFYNDCRSSHGDPDGHDHVWITEDVLEIIEWMTINLDMPWELIHVDDVDDKVGNGFTIVLRRL